MYCILSSLSSIHVCFEVLLKELLIRLLLPDAARLLPLVPLLGTSFEAVPLGGISQMLTTCIPSKSTDASPLGRLAFLSAVHALDKLIHIEAIERKVIALHHFGTSQMWTGIEDSTRTLVLTL